MAASKMSPFVINFLTFLCLLWFRLYVAQSEDEDNSKIFVYLPHYGILRGHHFGYYYSFKGVPYAEPPIGDKRFEPPSIYNKTWRGIRNATDYSKPCLQFNRFEKNSDFVMGAEDCLFLNIFTTNPKSVTKLPVIVFIHGGSFLFGDGSYYGPEILLREKSLVFVNFNYRLGPLGFLSTGNEKMPGNMGLKDQSIALQWIKQNIEYFGGDVDSVTISGISAGGASAHLHYFSPLSRGLFHRGISHSGCATNPWVFMNNTRKLSKQFAASLSCPTGNDAIMINCLKQKDGKEIVKAVQHFQTWILDYFSPFRVVIENGIENAFLPGHPYELLEAGNVTKVPWIVSFTDQEGLFPAADFIRDPEILPTLDENWNDLAPDLLAYKNLFNVTELKSISTRIKNHYFQSKPLSNDTFNNIAELIGDRMFVNDIIEIAMFQAKQKYSPVYMYIYRQHALRGFSYMFLNKYWEYNGAAHGDDMFILFKTPLRNYSSFSETERQMAKILTNFYYTFATGRLPKIGDIFLQVIDDENTDFKYVDVKNPYEISVKSGINYGQLEFWKSLSIF